MVNLSKLKGTFSVKDLYKAAINQETNGLLPMRIAWVNDDPAWENNWKAFELIARNRKLPWRSFSQTSSAEEWLIKNRQEALLDSS